MKIAIIGAGLAGLAAGRELAKAGHDITVIERNRELGGRLATTVAGESGELIFDTGVSTLKPELPLFRGFLSELLDKEFLRVWGDRIRHFNGKQLLESAPPFESGTRYVVPEGMNRVARYLSRWVDLRIGEQVGGLTYFGANRSKKRPWMVNLSSFNTFEADAVIISTPAPEAYGVLLTAQDEVEVFTMIREIDEIRYHPCHVLAASYADPDGPDWDAIYSEHPDLEWIASENSKRELPGRALVLRSTSELGRELRNAEPEVVRDRMLRAAGDILDRWIENPEWSGHRFWNYYRPVNVIDRPYMELAAGDAPLAVVGDYFEGRGHAAAYASGVRLARHWIERFQ